MKQTEGPHRADFFKALKGKFIIDPRRTAIVTVDMHRGHLDPAVATLPAPKENCANLIANGARVLRAARAAGIPVIHGVTSKLLIENERPRAFHRAVMDVNETIIPEEKSDLLHHNLKGSVQTEIIPELLEETDYVINNKKTHSVFFGTDLDNLLRILNVDHLVFMGVNTNTCVMNACFDASNLRYTLAVVSDCVDSFYGPDLHEFGLENIRRCLGWVFDSDEMVEKFKSAMAEAL